MIVAWFSGGITSAVACKIAVDTYKDVQPIFIETGSHAEDMPNFIAACEEWFGKKVQVLQDKRFTDHIDLILKEKYVNGPGGARCSLVLKKRVRQKYQQENKIEGQVFGFEFAKKEINRAVRFKEQNPEVKPLFPLIEKKLTKANCLEIVQRAGIKLPVNYSLGFSNNNCKACVKGGKAYFNLTRKHFPEWFDRMAKAERKLNRSCINGTFLDELDPDAGRGEEMVMPECDLFCEIEAAEILSSKTEAILSGCEEL